MPGLCAGPIAWIADNQLKGISAEPAVTIHATHAFSPEHWDRDRQESGRALLAAAHQHDYSERDAQNLVKVHIANLRRKMNDSRSLNPYILCVRGFGYLLERRYTHRDGDPLTELLEAE